MAPEAVSNQGDEKRPNEPNNESKEEHPSTGISLEEQRTEEKAPKNSALIIFCISCITFISCYLGGLVTVSVPTISKDLALDPGIELWFATLSETRRAKGTSADGVGRYPCMPLQQDVPFSYREPCRMLLGAALSS